MGSILEADPISSAEIRSEYTLTSSSLHLLMDCNHSYSRIVSTRVDVICVELSSNKQGREFLWLSLKQCVKYSHLRCSFDWNVPSRMEASKSGDYLYKD